jgi:sodium transport system ATP-binding protein
MIEVHNVTKSYRSGKSTVVALDDVSLGCRSGVITGILGPNGAGKSTLLRLISTVLKPTSGTLVVSGFDTIKHPAEVRSCIGFVSNSTALYGRLTPLEVLQYFGSLYGVPQPQLKKRIAELVERFTIGEYARRPIDKLSTGMRQKVSIARAVIHDPQILIFDEPTSGLDVLASRTVIEFLQEARLQGKTILLSTHLMREVERLCDDLHIIHRGRLYFSGTIAEFLSTRTPDEEIESTFLRVIQENGDTQPS